MSYCVALATAFVMVIPTSSTTQKPRAGERAARIINPSFSFDGRFLAMVVNEPGLRPSLRVVDLDTGKRASIPKLPGRIVVDSGPSWSPKDLGLTIACRLRNGKTEEWCLNVRTGEARRLLSTADRLIAPGRWSPDGTHLLLHCRSSIGTAWGSDDWVPGGWRSRLCVCSLDGRNEVIDGFPLIQDQGFDWRTDAKALWISTGYATGTHESVDNSVFCLPLDTRQPKEVSDLQHIIRLVRSPDGRFLVCEVQKQLPGFGANKLVLFNTANQAVVVVGEGGNLHHDCWGNDSNKLAYAGTPRGSVYIFDTAKRSNELLPQAEHTQSTFWRPNPDRVCRLTGGSQILEYDGSVWKELYTLPGTAGNQRSDYRYRR